MEQKIKPIETFYHGYRFRSRLEARWAVFFDALNVRFEYEPEGFDLGNGEYYLPDFRVKCWGDRGSIFEEPYDLYIEVKGRMTEDDANKIRKFAKDPNVGHLPIWEQADEYERLMNEKNMVLIVGNIPEEGCAYDARELGAYDPMNGIKIYPYNYELIDGDHFAAFPAAHKGKFFLCGDDSNYCWNEEEVERAYRLARQARFEHGETPILRRY